MNCDKCNRKAPSDDHDWTKGYKGSDIVPFTRCPRCISIGLLEAQKARILEIVEEHITNPTVQADIASRIREVSIME